MSPVIHLINKDGEARKAKLIKNKANEKEALVVETQAIESFYTVELEESVSEQTMIEPDDGNKLMITDVNIHTKANSGEVQLDIGDIKLARLYSSVNNRFSPKVSLAEGEVNEPLEITTTTGDDKVFVSVNYIEVEA